MWLYLVSLTVALCCTISLWRTTLTLRRLMPPVLFSTAFSIWISCGGILHLMTPPLPLVEWLTSTTLLLALVQFGVQALLGMPSAKSIKHATPALLASACLIWHYFNITPNLTLNGVAQTVAFLGLITLLQIMTLGEQLHSKRTDKTPQLLLSITLIWLPHFVAFCHLAIGGALHPWHLLAQTVALTLAFPWFYLWAQAHMRGQEQKTRPRSLSRTAAFQGTLLTLVGLYLLMLSGLGVLYRHNQWSDDTASLMLMAGIAPLLYLFGNHKTRRHLWVSINKHLTPSQFDYREAWMSLNQEFSPVLFGEQATLNGLNAISRAIQYPTGIYCRLHHGRWHLTSNKNDSPTSEFNGQLNQLFSLLGNNGWIIVVADEQKNDESNISIPEKLLQGLKQSKVHWVVPVVLNDELVGCWVVSGETTPGWPINWETRDFIATLAQQLEMYLRAQETTQELNANAQLAAFHQTSAFITHDLKNVFAQLKMLNRNAKVHRDNPEFIDSMLVTTASMESRMEKMLEQLSKKQHQTSQKENYAFVVHDWWRKYLSNQTQGYPKKLCHFTPPDEIPVKVMLNVEQERLNNVLSHLIDNAVHACEKNSDAKINITCECSPDHATIVVHDNGVGMSADLCQRIQASPFNTTKGNSGIGLGVYDAKTFADKAGGELIVTSQEGHGTTMRLVLPTWRTLPNEIADY